MPSIDPTTGKQNGAKNRARAAQNRATRAALAALDPELAAGLPEMRAATAPARTKLAPDPVPLTGVSAPPRESVDEAVTWAAQVLARAAVHAQRGLDPDRVTVVRDLVKTLGTLRLAAVDSEEVCTVAREYEGVNVVVQDEDPPTDAAGLPAWAFWRVVVLLYEVAIQTGEITGKPKNLARTYEAMRHVPPQTALDRHARAAAKVRETGRLPGRAGS